MPSNHVDRVLRNSEVVSRRAEESRREIAVLRAEYERLLERGLQPGASNVTDTDKEKEILNKREERSTSSKHADRKVIANSDMSEVRKVNDKKKPLEKPLPGDTARTVLDHGSPPKVRHYNVEDAREYIRRQKERRLQQQKQQRETDNVNEVKKQKLKELHQKSLQIVARNRQRSKSRDQQRLQEVETSVQELAPNTQHSSGVVKSIQQDCQPSSVAMKQHIAVLPIANITFRDGSKEQLNDNKYRKSSAKSDDAKIKAATLIQAYFRGHIQRKLYKETKMRKLNKKDDFMQADCNIHPKKPLENQSTFDDANNREVALKKSVNDQPKASEPQKKIPEWLQIEPDCHPYNFINSVKRKLSVALSTPVKTSDIGIQSSFYENFTVASHEKQEEKTPSDGYKGIIEKIEHSLIYNESEKQINAKIERSLDEFRNIQREHLSKISNKHSLSDHSEKYANKSRKTLETGCVNDKGFLELDVKRLNKLRLQSEHSDSDTSKNIPDISTESRIKTSCTSVNTSDSITSVFKLPREAPPKPKRLSRNEVHKKLDIANCDSKAEEFAKHAQEHLDEYKLNINVDRIKSIKLKRRMDDIPVKENTMMHLEHDGNTSIDEIHEKNNGLADPRENVISSSINTVSRSQNVNSQLTSQELLVSDEKSKSTGKSILAQESLKSSMQSNRHTCRMSHTSKKSHISHEHFKSSKFDSKKTDTRNSGSSSTFENSQEIPRNSRRDSTISGNITRYTKIFDTYNSNSPKSSEIKTLDFSARTMQDGMHDEAMNGTDNLQSFRQYMKEIDETQKITHTPFQPKGKSVFRNVDAEKRLQEVISKVNLLDMSRNIANSSSSSSSKISLSEQQPPESPCITAFPENNRKNNGNHDNEDDECVIDVKKCDILNIENGRNNDSLQIEEAQHIQENGLKTPDVNLTVTTKEDGNKLSANASVDTLPLVPGSTNQIHVKFEAEIHMLNDFNESLKHVMNIEKSMLELQTKYNLPTVQQTKHTQTSIKTSTSKSQKSPSSARSSVVEKSINFTRGSDIEGDIVHSSNEEKIIILHENKNLKFESTGSNSTLNISDILNDSNNSMFSKQHMITSNTSVKQLDTTDMGNLPTSWDKHSNVGVSLDMFDDLIKDEDTRIDNLKTELKIREKALLDRSKAELTWLEIQKKHLLETGKLHEASLLKKKQRGIILKLQEEKNEMQRLREAQKAASKERKTKLKEQRALIKAQLSGPHLVTRIRRSSERRASGPVKVYQSEYYQSETSVSRKSSVESITYSASASVVSHAQTVPDCEERPIIEAAIDLDNVPPPIVPNCTEMAKRSLQMREAALQRRKKEAEELLRWHQRLLKEERKIADLEMAASNVINQVPVTVADGGGDKYAYNVGAVIAPHMIWKTQSKNDGVITSKTCKAKVKQTLDNEANASMSSKYSSEFESEIPKQDGVEAEESIPQSESTLNEIMQNINNITGEISELYKLSSIQKTSSNDGNGSDNLPTDESLSTKEDSKSSIISNLNAVPHITNTEIATADKHSSVHVSVTDIPPISTQSRISKESKSVIRIDSQQLSLHDVKLPDPAETEDDVSSIKSDIGHMEEGSSKSYPDIPKTEVFNVDNVELSDASDTLIETKVEELKSILNLSETQTYLDVKGTENEIEAFTAEDVSDHVSIQEDQFLEQPKSIHTIDNQENVVEENMHTPVNRCQGKIMVEDLPSSTEMSLESQESSARFVDNIDISLVVIVEHDDLISYQLPSSNINTLIEVKEKTDHSEHDSCINEAIENIEVPELKDETDIDETLLSQNDLEESAIMEEKTDEISASLESAPIETPKVSSLSYENDEVGDLAENESYYIQDGSEHIDEIESNEIDSKDSEEVLPIIDIKIEEKKNNASLESAHIDLNSSEEKQVLESTEEEGCATECRLNKDDTNLKPCKTDSKCEVNVKKRVSEILADANLNTSIEEKSPRLPDIYVTTYDVISPVNSPELGSPVDNAKVKPKEVYGIGNEAQELLKKQLAIEQEIKQIERQQKEQLPYIFVREIPNKPPPPYTPPVQQPISIIPATPAQIEEIAPHLALIFHKGFVEKTLEYVTFPDTKLDQVENVDKICAEFLFDIAKDYAVSHYKQFVSPDENAPSWMKLNKPRCFKRPHTQAGLEVFLTKKLKQLFAFEKSDLKESMIIKWSRRKRDHVDELLVVESQSEEAEWTNYDLDELLVKEEVTTGLLDVLIEETAICLQEIFAKRQAI